MSTRAELRRQQREASKQPRLNTHDGPNRTARRKPHELVMGTEKDLPFKGLALGGNQVVVKCKYDNFLCMCPKNDMSWNFKKHVLQARGLPVPTDEEREAMAVNVHDTEGLLAAGPDDEVAVPYRVPATDEVPAFETTIYMSKRDYVADPDEAERRGREQYESRQQEIENAANRPPPTRDEQIAALQEQLEQTQAQLNELAAQPEEPVEESQVEPE